MERLYGISSGGPNQFLGEPLHGELSIYPSHVLDGHLKNLAHGTTVGLDILYPEIVPEGRLNTDGRSIVLIEETQQYWRYIQKILEGVGAKVVYLGDYNTLVEGL